MAKIVIVHGWGGNPNEGWFPWIKQQLEPQGHEVMIPSMPNPGVPKIEDWVNHLNQTIQNPNEQTHLIGHSIGCQTILRYLEQLPENVKVGKVILVAGFYDLLGLESEPGSEQIAKPWIETPIDHDKVKLHTTDFTVFLSDNDPWVDLQKNKELFIKNLNATIIQEHNKGHLSEEHGVTEYPKIIEILTS